MSSSSEGQTLVELLLAIGLMSILLPALFTGLFVSRQGKAQQKLRLQATGLMQEEMEALRSIRENGWVNLTTSGTYHAVLSGSTWTLVSGAETVNGFSRQVVLSDVYRDSNGNLVASSSSPDPSTKKAVITVSWSTPISTTVSQTEYFTRFINTSRITQTTQADFTLGTRSSTFVTNTAGGEVTLGAGGGGGDWCNPSLSVTTVNLSRQGVPTSIAAFPGTIVTGTGGNASGPTYVKTAVSSDNPPIATVSGQFNNSKANGVFAESNYGYIATTSNSQEVQILDLTQFSDPPTNSLYKQVGQFNAPGNGQGNSVFATGTVGYMTDGNKFYTFDLSSHIGARSQLNGPDVTLAGNGVKVIVVGNYAYVATDNTTTQLQVIDVTDPTHPSIVASSGMGNSQAGIDVSVNATGTRAYVVTNYISSATPDFFIVDTSVKSGTLPLIGTGFNTNGMSPKGVSVATGNRAIIVGTGGTLQYQVVNITNEATPVACKNNGVTSGLQIPSGVYAIATVQSNGYAYSYIVTGDTNAELKMILGGAGGQFTSSGTYESSIIDLGFPVVFNNILATVAMPSQTSISLQVAGAAPVSGSCTNALYTYVGPNASSSVKFTPVGSVINATIPTSPSGSYLNPVRCFRYKVYFSTQDITVSPILYDATINYTL